MAKAKQLTVTVENRPGAGAEVARVLGNAKVNILALSGTGSGDTGTVHIVVDNPRRAKNALSKAGLAASESTVTTVDLPNTPGALAKYLGRLAAKNVNLTTVYATASKGGRKATVVIGTE